MEMKIAHRLVEAGRSLVKKPEYEKIKSRRKEQHWKKAPVPGPIEYIAGKEQEPVLLFLSNVPIAQRKNTEQYPEFYAIESQAYSG